jgi:hypothetical protein
LFCSFSCCRALKKSSVTFLSGRCIHCLWPLHCSDCQLITCARQKAKKTRSRFWPTTKVCSRTRKSRPGANPTTFEFTAATPALQ